MTLTVSEISITVRKCNTQNNQTPSSTTFDIECCYVDCRYAQCHYAHRNIFIIMMSVIMLSVIMLSVITTSVTMLGVAALAKRQQSGSSRSLFVVASFSRAHRPSSVSLAFVSCFFPALTYFVAAHAVFILLVNFHTHTRTFWGERVCEKNRTTTWRSTTCASRTRHLRTGATATARAPAGKSDLKFARAYSNQVCRTHKVK